MLQRYTTNEFVVKMPMEYPGAAQRIAKVVALVGDSKWIWSVFGVVQNWTRPVATGPFTTTQVNEAGVHMPVVYDRQFYRDIFSQYVEITEKAREVKHAFVRRASGGARMDPRRQKQQFEKFCADELGFRVEEIGNFAVHFGWEGAWVGPLHAVGTATRNTYSQWLSIFHTLGMQNKFEEYLHGFKIDVRTILRSCKGGEKLVAASVWADAGDLIDAVTKDRVFPIKHPDTMSPSELQEAYDEFLPGVEVPTPQLLINAVAERDGVNADLMGILLMCEHLFGAMCKTVWSKDESWEDYIERVRVYDPTAASFKRMHYALLFGHGLDTSGSIPTPSEEYQVRPAPSQQNLIHGQGVPLRRLLDAGLRMINANEAHLEHRHMLRKALINLNCLHQIARGLGKDSDKDQATVTRDQIRRGKNLLLQQQIQLSKMFYRGKDALAKDTWASKHWKQFGCDQMDHECMAVETQNDDESEAESHSDQSDDELEAEDPVAKVVRATHAETLTQQHLEDAGVVGAHNMSTKLIECMSDLIADCWPEPRTADELNDLMETAMDLTDTVDSTSDDETAERSSSAVACIQAESATSTDTTPIVDVMGDDESMIPGDPPPLPGAPPNDILKCESAISGKDKCASSTGQLLKLHFMHGAGNIEIRSTKSGSTRSDLIPMESVYALWMAEDTVHLVLSCPTRARKLKDGRWREAQELSMFKSNNPIIKVKITGDREVTRSAVNTCRRMHPEILSQLETMPEDFSDDVLTRRAAEYREKTVFSRMPTHIRAFLTIKDDNASADERATAQALISSLVSYCNEHWRLYVDTILRKTRHHGFPLRCLCCGEKTRWLSSGLRVGQNGHDHQYCKKFSACVTPEMQRMLQVPTIASAWRKVRKSYDPNDVTDFDQREEARRLAVDHGFAV